MARPAPLKSTFGKPGKVSPTLSTGRKSSFAGLSPVMSPEVIERGKRANEMHNLFAENIEYLRAAEDGATLLHALAILLEKAGAVSFSDEARASAAAIERIAKLFPEADAAEKGDVSDSDAAIADYIGELRLALRIDH